MIGERVRRAVNVALCLTAVVGTGWGGYETYSVLSARSEINAACAGLVPVGKGEGERTFFEAFVTLEPDTRPVQPDEHWAFERSYRPTVDTPLGHGIPGLASDSGVKVKLTCAGKVRRNGAPVEEITAYAGSTTTGYTPVFKGRGQVSGDTRDVLASIAVDVANRTAERLGCESRLPDAPAGIPQAVEDLTPAPRASGTCGWYAKARDQDVLLPDRVVGTRADPDVWTESCGLLMSQVGASQARADGYGDLDPLARDQNWSASLDSWFGTEAENVTLPRLGTDDPVEAAPGKAGRSDEKPAWWASSVCHGKPAVHTLVLGGAAYAERAAPHFAKIFRAYAEDTDKS
ncbi:hypothetical protein [Streptomyces sp. N35]|uniref:hypothetical protein n=1 Tax=Streptomyces sp. N35 TaxID=2795730 RepID=UPI0018F48891|nr:hypothetical protein [Streptomyces sp. N35]